MIAEKLIKDIGTGLIRVYELTDKGMKIAEQLRRHKMNGGVFHTFEPKIIQEIGVKING